MTASNNDVPRSAPLTGVRVLEWSRSIAGGYAGRTLRDAGARVVRAGAPGSGPERPALAAYLHSGKERTDADLADLPRVSREVDADIVLIELPDAPDAELRAAFDDDRVVVFLTPWGLDGPWAGAGRPWSEFTLQAESGSLSIRGVLENDPLATGSAEPLWIAGAMAAGAAIAALQGGPDGRVLDVPLLEVSGYSTNLFIDVMAAVHGMPREPFLQRRRLTPSVEPASDGWVGFNLASVQNHEDFLVLIERPDYLADEEMKTHEGRYRRAAELTEAVRSWTRRHTVAEIVERAAAFRIPCAPVHNGRTILDDPQIVARDFYPDHPGGGFREPAPPFLFDGERPARTGAAAAATGERPDRQLDRPAPFAGLRVLDLGTWWVGAYVGSLLGAFGADVIKVESTNRIDGSRTMGGLPPTRDHWWECSNFYLGANGNKRNVTLDLSQPDGVALLRELIASADVLIENYAPRVLESVGLDWAAVHELNPRLVMHRMPAFGLTGPRRSMVGYAQTVEQFSGLAWRTGYPDGDPTNPSGPADPMGAANSFFALAAAIYRSRRTGVGMLVESPLAEAALVMTAEQVIAWTGDRELLTAQGNRGSEAHLQGAFRARGTDRWVGISVLDEAQWTALTEVTGFRHWADETDLADRAGRRARAAALEKELSGWIAERDADDVVETLLAAGVPAARLIDARFLHEHPQLAGRGSYELTELPYAGTLALPTLPFRRVGQPQWMRRRPPTLGEHNAEILGGELGLSDERLADLERRGVIGTRPLGF
ncbi:CaiB/BaiF CoA-transferase family protein [Cryptosporangium minutisporangium]|uniref:CoA transferase n=1 Tax=Cryptosporangium minutisporangium TaxID=113569 RepID=A0ABP6SRT3_9ACTN